MSGNNNQNKNSGYLPCFSSHQDKKFKLKDFFNNKTFRNKLKIFLSAIIESKNINELRQKTGQGIVVVDPKKPGSRNLLKMVNWSGGKMYRVDYGDTKHRLVFGLENSRSRCYILALDSKHKTWSKKKHQR